MIQLSEISRKTIHLFNMIIPMGYLFIVPGKNNMLIIMGSVSAVFLLIEWGRLRIGWIKAVFARVFDFMLRTHELNGRFTGATWVVIGSFFTILFFPKEIAILALLYMSLGDTVAAIVGLQFGRISIGKKTLEGSLAGLIACLIVAFFFEAVPVNVRITGAIVAMLVELIPLRVDDNISIPLSAGLAMLIVNTVY